MPGTLIGQIVGGPAVGGAIFGRLAGF